MSGLSAPVPLSTAHDLSAFDCGDEGVNAWLRGKALLAQQSGSARTFVICDGIQVAAFYCLSTASFERADLGTAKQRAGMPGRVPAILVGQLGVDGHYQGRGLGWHLIKDAMGRALSVSEQTGVVVMMHLHATTDAARDYYLHLDLGLQVSRSEPLTLYLPIATIRWALLPE